MNFIANKFHRKSLRLNGYDYAQSGAYFITICTTERELYFGKVIHGKMELNICGQIANFLWQSTSSRFRNIQIGPFVVMPNHLHAILIIELIDVISDDKISVKNDRKFHDNLPINIDPQNGTKKGSLSAVIQNYKALTSRKIRLMPGLQNVRIWQRNYYDHIIRDQEDYDRIAEYICSNPEQWEADEWFSNG